MSRRRRRALAALVMLVVLGGVATLALRGRGGGGGNAIRATSLGGLARREVTAPADTRVRVEVINAARTDGLARRVTRFLRDRGFDVVSYGTSGQTQDATVVLDRSGHPEWARLVAEALGGASVETRPDTSRYVDITVVLGAAWRPPPQPFSP
jgi:hypothetical protein